MAKTERIILYSLLGILFVLAAVFDLSITQNLFQPNNVLGRLGETLGEVPCYLVGAFAACLIALHHPRLEGKKNLVVTIIFFVLTAGVAIYGGYHTNKLLMRSFSLTYGTGVKLGVIAAVALVLFAIAFLCARLVKEGQKKEAFALGVFVAVLAVSSLLVMQGLKMIWLRPRYRTLVALEEAGAIDSAASYWKAFWEPQFFTSFKKYEVGGDYGFTQAQIDSVLAKLSCSKWSKEEFYSFPSGHTMNSFFAVSLCYLPRLFPKLDKGKFTSLIIRVCVYLFVALVAFTRILRGAHNATDVLAGYIFVVILFDLLSRLFYERFLREKILPSLK